MPNTKEKPVELCEEMEDLPCCDTYEGQAEYLISNGVTIQEWIPMTERFPKNGTICLVCTKYGDMYVRLWDVAELFWIGEAGGFDLRIDEVTHWMPLPEAPKGELG